MKINLNKNKMSDRLIWAGLATGVAGVMYATIKQSNDIKKDINEAQNYIKYHNLAKYQYLNKKQSSYLGKSVNWAAEAKNVQDSLKIDSIAKVNYAKGMQAVRDSIKAVDKK